MHSFGGIILRETYIALVRNPRYDTTTFPKGRPEFQETALETALREINEETGLNELTLIEKLGSYDRPQGKYPDRIKTITLFYFQTNQRPLYSQEPKVEPIWVPLEDLPARLSYSEDQAFFSSIQKKIF
jgi:ADP-ribose pyrophosphatase YjhB (NUDIX family)